MSTGIICCIATFIFILVAICWIYKNKSKCINHPIVICMSVISLIIAVTTAIYLCCSGGCFGISNIDYGDTSVTVLSAIVGLLIGWSIYTAIDINNRVDKFKYSVSISTCISLKNLGEALYNNEDYANSLHAFLNAIYMYEKEAKNEMMDDAFRCSKRNIKNIKEKSITIECTNKEYIRFVCAASKTEDRDIISYVSNFKVI